MCLSCGALIDAIDAYLTKADEDLAEQLAAEGYVEAAATVETINELEELVTALLVNNADELLAKLNEAVDIKTFFADNWPEIRANGALAQQLFDVFHEEFTTIMPQYVEAYVRQTDAELVVTQMTKRTTDWISSWSEELADLMHLETNRQIEAVLTKGLDEGKSIVQIADDIAESGIRSPGYRARRAALTETLRAHSYAQLESCIQSPAVESKAWKHSGGYRIEPRANHMAMDGVSVPKNEPFTLYGADGSIYYPMVPRDAGLPASESVNCHCLIQPIVSEDVLGLSLEERKRLQAEAIAEDDGEWMKELDAKNKAKAGIDLTSADTKGIIKVSKTTLTAEPNSITQIDSSGGGVTRNYYDENGRWLKQITNNDHGYPSKHPFGDHGEHTHEIVWEDDVIIDRPMREMSQSEKEDNKDIL